jgi:Uma2 family endonuclease
LFQLLAYVLRGRATVGSDQFIYYDASQPQACLAPDAYVKLGPPQSDVTSWKTWERGTPELAVEVVSRSDAPEEPWQGKLTRYHRLGVRELVRFDQASVEQLRVWDYVDGDLVERRLVPNTPVACRTLGLWWVTTQSDELGPMLRLARDAEGRDLLKGELEAANEAREREAEARQREAKARQHEAEARQAAEARVRELEAELRRLRGGDG